MPINVTIDLGEAYDKVSEARQRKAQLEIANQILIDMDPYIPLLHGPLRLSGHVSPDGEHIEYNTPYARAQFYGSSYNKNTSFEFHNYTTPGTGKRWDLKAKGIHGNSWAEVGMKALGIKK